MLVEASFLEKISSCRSSPPKDLRDRAVRLVREHRGDYDTEREAIGQCDSAELGPELPMAATIVRSRSQQTYRAALSTVGYRSDHTWIREVLKILLPICSHP